mgnify:CR=1 FL=1
MNRFDGGDITIIDEDGSGVMQCDVMHDSNMAVQETKSEYERILLEIHS